jgi:hypothetical protein
MIKIIFYVIENLFSLNIDIQNYKNICIYNTSFKARNLYKYLIFIANNARVCENMKFLIIVHCTRNFIVLLEPMNNRLYCYLAIIKKSFTHRLLYTFYDLL